jgi:hypothetical protein
MNFFEAQHAEGSFEKLVFINHTTRGARGRVVDESLCYKPEGRRFEFRMRWIFFN